MLSIASIISNPHDLLALESEEVAGVLLEYLNALYPDEPKEHTSAGQPHRHNFFISLQSVPPYPNAGRELNHRVSLVLMEAWSWLERENFIAVRVGLSSSDDYFITRRGRRVRARSGLQSYQKANLLPRGKVHPAIADKVYAPFLRGEYDTAVFQAFREVEIAVRAGGAYAQEMVGVKLMREAFRPTQGSIAGPLTDKSLPIAEQEGMMNLFAGAIALYKNPQSHRNVPTEPVDAAEVIMFASHLLRIIDRRRANLGSDE